MKKKKNITIGIPAFNEEINIGHLLKDIFSQECKGYIIKRVIVYSDGSTDSTTEVVKKIKNKKILLIDNRKRKGVAHGVNALLERANSEIFVLLNADIRITDRRFLEKIIDPIINAQADLSSCKIREVGPTTIVEKILYAGMSYKHHLFETFRNGQNLYTCHGPARAFSKRLYSNFRLKQSSAEDMYSYLFCVSRGYKYCYVKDTFVYYKLPDNLKDHEKQSVRFINAKTTMSDYFESRFVKREQYLPLGLHVKSIFLTLKKYPVYMALYVGLFFYMKLVSIFKTKITHNGWPISVSSKTIKI